MRVTSRLLLIAFTATAMWCQTADRAEITLRAAMKKETVDGDLKSAIDQYKKLAQGKDRVVAAKALVRMGQCYEKLGDAESRKAYERVVREFGDQKEAVAEARARMTVSGAGAAAAGIQTERVVWSGPKADASESSISPDGRYISFPDWDTGNLGLYDLVTGTDRLLTNTGAIAKRGESAFAEVSAFSRDGKEVAYAWFDEKTGRYELRVVNVNGDQRFSRVFADKNISYLEPREWSPDGKWILATLWHEHSEQSPSVADVGLINVRDGALRTLYSGSDIKLSPPHFSPNGGYVVYSRSQQRGVGKGYIISVATRQEIEVLPGASSVESPLWTPDGSRIVFISDRSGYPGVWAVPISEGKPAGEPELLKNRSDSSSLLAFTRNGSLLYSQTVRQSDIYVASMDPSTGKLVGEPKRVNQRGIGNSAGRVAWAPDGKSLSFWSRVPEESLTVHSLETAAERVLWITKEGSYRGYAGWFPDGRGLMSTKLEGQVISVQRVDDKTGQVTESWSLPVKGRLTTFTNSPDLMTRFGVRKDQTVPCNRDICTFLVEAQDVKTGDSRNVFDIRARNVRSIAVSPDARDIALSFSDSEGVYLVAGPTAGGAPREIYRYPKEVFLSSLGGLCWAKDGRHIFVTRRTEKGGELWSVPLDGGPVEKSVLRIGATSNPAVSPAGTQIAFVGENRTSELRAITGLIPEVKAAGTK